MQTHNVIPGSPEWLKLREGYDTASEAPAAAGVSKYMTRDALLRQKALGTSEDVSAGKQRLFDRGHEAEAAARSIAEAALEADLFPVTGTLEVDGLRLLASFDGLTMDEETVWETKLYNDDLARQVESGDLEPHYWYQLEQQLLVSGASQAWFTASDGTPERTHGMFYRSRPERRAQLIAAWKQFRADLADYKPAADAPKITAAAIDDLPALIVDLTGEVKSTNMVDWKATVVARIQAIKTDLKTDDDFATAAKTVTFLGDGEKKLELVKSQALAQTKTIDELFRTIDTLKEEMRAKRLTLTNLVKVRKEAVRAEILQEGADALKAHIAGLNTRLGKPWMPVVPVDFAGAMSGKKTIASLRSAVSDALANGKIAASAIADKIDANIKVLAAQPDYGFLFHDAPAIVLKANDDFAILVKSRIDAHKAAEAAKEEATRERIRAEEAEKLAKQQREEAARQAAQVAPPPVASPAIVSASSTAPIPQPPAWGLPPRTATVQTLPGRIKPSGPELVEAVALHFHVSAATAADWLMNTPADEYAGWPKSA